MTDLDENKTPEAIIAEAMVSAGAPLMHSRVEEAVAGALRKAGMLAEQSGQVCAWCPSPARVSAHHNDGKLHPSCGQTNHGQGWVPDYPVERIGAIEAERDAALARIAELEKMLENYTREYPIECNKRVKAEARIAEAAKLHRKYTYHDLEDSCPDTTDEHREEHHHEASDDIGEFYCDQMPTGDVCCGTCRDVNGDRVPWPCPTAVSLGLNEGENDD